MPEARRLPLSSDDCAQLLRRELQIVTEPRRAADELDLAANGRRGDVDGIVENKTARRDERTFAQIERLGQPDRIHLVGSLPEKWLTDPIPSPVHVARTEDHADEILFGEVAAQVEATAELELRVAIKVVGQRRNPGLQVVF